MNSAGLPDPAFWNRLTDTIGPRNTERLDYIGLDAFPDVFRPIAHENLRAAVTFLLQRFRAVTAEAGVPVAVPIHVTETGWPTGDQRTESAQAEVLALVADAVTASDVGVQACEWFGLRDELTTATWSARFGILRDDYTPKPAFATLQHVIMAVGARLLPADDGSPPGPPSGAGRRERTALGRATFSRGGDGCGPVGLADVLKARMPLRHRWL